jgi:3-methyl-2-oxobutanoate hydroxymethyltransferase
MKQIYTWDAQPARRNLTVADLRAGKSLQKRTQTTANTAEEAAAASDAGIDLIMGNAQNTALARQGAPQRQRRS